MRLPTSHRFSFGSLNNFNSNFGSNKLINVGSYGIIISDDQNKKEKKEKSYLNYSSGYINNNENDLDFEFGNDIIGSDIKNYKTCLVSIKNTKIEYFECQLVTDFGEARIGYGFWPPYNSNDVTLIMEESTTQDIIFRDTSVNDRIKDDRIKDDLVKDDLVKDDLVKDDHINNDLVKDDHIKDDLVKDDHIKDDLVKDDHIKDDHIKDDRIKNDHVKNDHMELENHKIINLCGPLGFDSKGYSIGSKNGYGFNKSKRINFGIGFKKDDIISCLISNYKKGKYLDFFINGYPCSRYFTIPKRNKKQNLKEENGYYYEEIEDDLLPGFSLYDYCQISLNFGPYFSYEDKCRNFVKKRILFNKEFLERKKYIKEDAKCVIKKSKKNKR